MTILEKALSERTARNGRYSARAFARFLQLDPGALSRILAGKLLPSVSACASIIRKLQLSESESRRFISSVSEARKAEAETKVASCANIAPLHLEFDEVDFDQFQKVADIHHVSVLEACTQPGAPDAPQWHADLLGITTLEAREIIDRLLRLNMLKADEGRLVTVRPHLTSKDKHKTSAAHKQLQRQVLDHARASLDTCPLERRVHMALTLAMDPAKVPLARTLLHDFLKTLTDLLSDGEAKEIYHIGVHVCPTKSEPLAKG